MLNINKTDQFIKVPLSVIDALNDFNLAGVYGTIKSFCGDGQFDKAVSIREISNRCRLKKDKVSRIVDILIKVSAIEVVGQEKRVGGTVRIFKCRDMSHLSVSQLKDINYKSRFPEKSVPDLKESVSYLEKSVSQGCANPISPYPSIENIENKKENDDEKFDKKDFEEPAGSPNLSKKDTPVYEEPGVKRWEDLSELDKIECQQMQRMIKEGLPEDLMPKGWVWPVGMPPYKEVDLTNDPLRQPSQPNPYD